MYLTARRYVSEFSDKELCTNLNKVAEGVRKGYEIQYITVEAMYWRKANAIHQWLVENVQNGVDDCQVHPVTSKQLRKLISTIEDVLENKVNPAEALPSSTGFFFGSSEYNEWYFDDLERTREGLTNLLDDLGDHDWTWQYYYQSSW
jgi:hypothetical protein